MSSGNKLGTRNPLPLISPQNKGLGLMTAISAEEVSVQLDWNLLREDLSLPVAVLDGEMLKHNLEWMRQFIDAYEVRLAPHGKTTMAPKLFDLQMSHGAWGITLATAHQTFVAWQHGIRRVLMANQLVGRQNMALVSRMLEDPAIRILLSRRLSRLRAPTRRFLFRARSICMFWWRSVSQVGAAACATMSSCRQCLRPSPHRTVRWCSTASSSTRAYLDDESAVRTFLERAAAITAKLMAERRFDRKPPILTGAGSTWFDVVAEVFSSASFPSRLKSCCGQAVISRTMPASIARPTPGFFERNPSLAECSRAFDLRSRSGPTSSLFLKRREPSSASANATHHSILAFRCRPCIYRPGGNAAQSSAITLEADQNDGSARVSRDCCER